MATPRIGTSSTSATPAGKPKAGRGRGISMVLKLFPVLTTGCKVVTLLGKPSKALLARSAMATVTLFGYRRGRVTLAIQEHPSGPSSFLVELPLLTGALHKEMASGLVRIALESDTRTHRKKLTDENVWAVYCNGRRSGYSVRRKQSSEEETHVMQVLRGVSMGAGVLPSPSSSAEEAPDGELTYMRARFERVVGSRDSEALYMINPDSTGGPELSIFLVRKK